MAQSPRVSALLFWLDVVVVDKLPPMLSLPYSQMWDTDMRANIHYLATNSAHLRGVHGPVWGNGSLLEKPPRRMVANGNRAFIRWSGKHSACVHVEVRITSSHCVHGVRDKSGNELTRIVLECGACAWTRKMSDFPASITQM